MAIVTKENFLKTNIVVSMLIYSVVLLTGCANGSQFATEETLNSDLSTGGVQVPGNSPASGSPSANYKMAPLSWESPLKPERKAWSEYLQKIILKDWNKLLPGANDINQFCPKYHGLDNNQRANVWAQIFSAISKYESGYNPLSRMQETTMGEDFITRKPVYSEGLLQLSYQDTGWAKWCDFDWEKDKDLSVANPKKTILDPYNNLDCGVGIMAKQVSTKGSIVLSSGVYWAVIKAGGRYQKIDKIQAIVRSLPMCK